MPGVPQPIVSRESPRQIISEDFKTMRGELPIKGGWGYTKGDAVIIDADDPVVPRDVPFDGVGIEYIFVEKRIFEEMIIFRAPGKKFSDIDWKLIQQQLISDGERYFDHLQFEISALPDHDWEQLKEEWEGPNGFRDPKFDRDAHFRKREQKTVRFTRDFWFDITSFHGKGGQR